MLAVIDIRGAFDLAHYAAETMVGGRREGMKWELHFYQEINLSILFYWNLFLFSLYFLQIRLNPA